MGKGRDTAAVMGEDYQPSLTAVRSEPVEGRRLEVCDAHGKASAPVCSKRRRWKKTLAPLRLLCGTEEEMKNTFAFLLIASLALS